MDGLPFPLIAGDSLHHMGEPGVTALLLATANQPATRAEIVVGSLRAWGTATVYYQEGNGAFDLYELGDAVRGIDVKNRSSKFANDLEGWNNTVNQIDEAARAGVALEPWIEQIVTDESGRRTWLLFPGIIPQSRAFAARGKDAVSAQLDRFVRRRLDSKDGVVLLRDVPPAVYRDWERVGANSPDLVQEYHRNLTTYYHRPGVHDMARRAVERDRKRVHEMSFESYHRLVEGAILRGDDNDNTRLFLNARRAEEADARAEQEAARAAQEAARAEQATTRAEQEAARASTFSSSVAELSLQLEAALESGDVAKAMQINAALKALAQP